MWPQKHAEIVRLMGQVLGDQVSGDEVGRLAREFFRFRSCEIMDVMRLRGRARSLERLVEIRGREHLEAALAGGKGAILHSAHFGSYHAAFSLVNAMGYPVTTIGQWDWKLDTAVSPVERRFWDFALARRVLRHRRQPNFEPWPRRFNIALKAAATLRDNEFVTISSDAAPLAADQARSLVVPFLGGKARMLPGAVSIAKLTGAPMLMIFMYRSADYRHQTLEISPPVPMEGDTETAFGRCAAAIDAAIQRDPASWTLWIETEALVRFGLVPAMPPAETTAAELQQSTR
jgi:lauroyl/myristoyl acyltransferase